MEAASWLIEWVQVRRRGLWDDCTWHDSSRQCYPNVDFELSSICLKFSIMKNTIRLEIHHPDKSRVEYFLNNVGEALEQLPFDAGEFNGVDDTATGYKFSVKDRDAFIIVILADSYFEASTIEAANSGGSSNIRWTINGGILFGIESADEQVAKQWLSFFAGRE